MSLIIISLEEAVFKLAEELVVKIETVYSGTTCAKSVHEETLDTRNGLCPRTKVGNVFLVLQHYAYDYVCVGI